MLVTKDVIQTILTAFLAISVKDSRLFHAKDVEMVKDNSWWIERFVLVSNTEDDAYRALINSMIWRKSFGVHDLTEANFLGISQIGVFNCTIKDKESRNILKVKLSNYRKNELSPLFKQKLVYLVEKLDRQASNESWTAIADATGMDSSNVDMDFYYFFIQVFQSYYPRGYRNVLVVNLPVSIDLVAQLCVSVMNDEMKSRVKFITGEQLAAFVDPKLILEEPKNATVKVV